ncbi:MAG: Hsp20/alpha crystallin family protein [Gammaproteobacteria bacterium]
MTLTRYEPWNALHQFRNELFNAFDGKNLLDNDSNVATSDWTPAVDVKEKDEAFIINADIPGVDPKNIEVHMENGVLTIRGEKTAETSDEKEGYKRVERSYGSFYRRFSLPDSADAENIKAKSHNGVLELTIPKTAKVKARRITVDS